MDIWENTVLTDKGRSLQAKQLQGQTLKITRVTTGAKKVPIVDLRQQTNVSEGGYDITVQPSRIKDHTTILPVLLDNVGLAESYDFWQIGFFAEDPDEGEILFCISQASQPKHVPSEFESPGYSITWDFYFHTSSTVPFEVVLNSSGLINIEAYQEHTESINQIYSRIDTLNSALSYTASSMDIYSRSKIMVGTNGELKSVSIAIQNCKEIYSAAIKMPFLFYGTNNGTLVSALIHVTFNDGKVYSASITNIIGSSTITRDEWGFTLGGLSNWGNYVIEAPPGVLLTSTQKVVIPNTAV